MKPRDKISFMLYGQGYQPPQADGVHDDVSTQDFNKQMADNQAYDQSLPGKISGWLNKISPELNMKGDGATIFGKALEKVGVGSYPNTSWSDALHNTGQNFHVANVATEGMKTMNRWAGASQFPEKLETADMIAPMGAAAMAAPFMPRGMMTPNAATTKPAKHPLTIPSDISVTPPDNGHKTYPSHEAPEPNVYDYGTEQEGTFIKLREGSDEAYEIAGNRPQSQFANMAKPALLMADQQKASLPGAILGANDQKFISNHTVPIDAIDRINKTPHRQYSGSLRQDELDDFAETYPNHTPAEGSGRPATMSVYRGEADYGGTARKGFNDEIPGPWFSSSSRVANSYTDGDVADYLRSSPHSISAEARFDNPYIVDAGGRSFEKTVPVHGRKMHMDSNLASEMAYLNGHDGIIIKNVIDPGSIGPDDSLQHTSTSVRPLRRGTIFNKYDGSLLFADQQKASLPGAILGANDQQPNKGGTGPRTQNDQTPFYGEQVGPKGLLAGDPAQLAKDYGLMTGLPGAPTSAGRFNPATSALLQAGVAPKQTAAYYRKQLQGRGGVPPGSLLDDTFKDLGVTRPDQVISRDDLVKALDDRSPKIIADTSMTDSVARKMYEEDHKIVNRISEISEELRADVADVEPMREKALMAEQDELIRRRRDIQNESQMTPTAGWRSHAIQPADGTLDLDGRSSKTADYRERVVGHEPVLHRYLFRNEEFPILDNHPVGKSTTAFGPLSRDYLSVLNSISEDRIGAFQNQRGLMDSFSQLMRDKNMTPEQVLELTRQQVANGEVHPKTMEMAQKVYDSIQDAYAGRKRDAGTPDKFDDAHFEPTLPERYGATPRSNLEGWTRTTEIKVPQSKEDYASAKNKFDDFKKSGKNISDDSLAEFDRLRAEINDLNFDKHLFVDEAQDQRRRMVDKQGAKKTPEQVEALRRSVTEADAEVLRYAKDGHDYTRTDEFKAFVDLIKEMSEDSGAGDEVAHFITGPLAKAEKLSSALESSSYVFKAFDALAAQADALLNSDYLEAGTPEFSAARKVIEFADGKKSAEERYNNLSSELHASSKGVAPSPYTGSKADSTRLLARQIIGDAAGDQDMKGIAWARGDENAVRMNIGQFVDTLVYDTSSGELVGVKDGQRIISRRVPEKDLAEYVGEEVANQLINSPEARDGTRHKISPNAVIGGHGMKSFYGNERGIGPDGRQALFAGLMSSELQKLDPASAFRIEPLDTPWQKNKLEGPSPHIRLTEKAKQKAKKIGMRLFSDNVKASLPGLLIDANDHDQRRRGLLSGDN